MSRTWHRLLQIVLGSPEPWEIHAETVASSFFLRGLAQNVTMVGFLGMSTFWMSKRLLTVRLVDDTSLWPELSYVALAVSSCDLNYRGLPILPLLAHTRRPLHLPTHLHRLLRHLGI